MANLNITEYSGVSNKTGAPVAIVALPPVATQNITLTTTSAAAANAFNPATKLVRLQTDTLCFIRIASTTPTAVNTDMPLAPGLPEYFEVTAGYFIAARS